MSVCYAAALCKNGWTDRGLVRGAHGRGGGNCWSYSMRPLPNYLLFIIPPVAVPAFCSMGKGSRVVSHAIVGAGIITFSSTYQSTYTILHHCTRTGVHALRDIYHTCIEYAFYLGLTRAYFWWGCVVGQTSQSYSASREHSRLGVYVHVHISAIKVCSWSGIESCISHIAFCSPIVSLLPFVGHYRHCNFWEFLGYMKGI